MVVFLSEKEILTVGIIIDIKVLHDLNCLVYLQADEESKKLKNNSKIMEKYLTTITFNDMVVLRLTIYRR